MRFFIMLWAWLFGILNHPRITLWLFPSLAVLEEWLRSFVFTGLPWTAIGNLLVDTPASSWISIVGSYGAAWFIVFIATTLVLLLTSEHKKQAAVALAACLCVIFFSPRIDVPKHPTHTAALVQPNIPLDKKWDASFVRETMFRLVLLSEQAPDADLIVWPEASVPMYLSRNPGWDKWLAQTTQHWHGALAFGGIRLTDTGKSQSGLFLAEKNQEKRTFAGKHHLVPFGEYVPSWLPFLGKMIPDIGDFEPASDNGVLTMHDQKLGSIICYESLFVEEAFARVRNGANVLIVVTNDAWYGKSPAAWQHFQASQVRAIENGRYVLRAANTGITAIIAPDGSIQKTMPWWEAGVVIGTYQPLNHATIYQQYGNTPIFTLAFAILLLAGYPLYRKEKWI